LLNGRCTSLLRAPRLRNDLYCVEWDVKLYYTILASMYFLLFLCPDCATVVLPSIRVIPLQASLFDLQNLRSPFAKSSELREDCVVCWQVIVNVAVTFHCNIFHCQMSLCVFFKSNNRFHWWMLGISFWHLQLAPRNRECSENNIHMHSASDKLAYFT